MPSTSLETLAALARSVASDPRRFLIYANEPVGFVRDVLGVANFWEKQAAVAEAARDYRRVVVRSGHGTGKTHAVACLVLWWLYARQGLVVTTAPTKEHVEDVLWRQIHELRRNAPVPLPGEPMLSELRIDETWGAVGITADKPEAFTGRHHPRLLVVVDEAPGVTEPIHVAIASLATGDENRIVMIGNPTTTSGTFYDAFKMPDIWHGFRISCFDHPNVVLGKEVIKGAVTRRWIEERKRVWGENHPLWYSRVLGDFPKISARGVIPLGWVERAQNEEKRLAVLAEAESAGIARVGGLDVARYGDNACVLIVRRGDAVESIESWTHTSLMETAGKAIRAIRDLGLQFLVVDAAGLGAGVVDRLLEQNMPVYAYNGGHRAFTPSTHSNRRGEMWWHLRQRLEKEKLWIPSHDILVSDLVTPEYTLTSSGRVQIETKEQLLKRGAKSPDFGDALSLCFAADEDPEAVFVEPRAERQDPFAYEMLQPIDPNAAAPFGQFPVGF